MRRIDYPVKGEPVTPWANQVTEAIRLIMAVFGDGCTDVVRSGRSIAYMPDDPEELIFSVKTPVGGIAAMDGSGLPGSATCLVRLWDGTNWTTGTEEVEVLNDFTSAVSGAVLLKVHRRFGKIWALAEDCPAS